MMKHVVLAVLAIFFFHGSVAQASEVPVEAFGKLPVVRMPVVSPDGRHIAVMVRNDSGYYDVMVTPYDKFEFKPLASLKKAYDRIEYIYWANDERLLVSASFPETIGKHRYRVPKLYSFDINTGEQVQLSYRSRRTSLYTAERQKYQNDASIVSRLRNDPDHILVAVHTPEDTGPSVFRVNVYDGTFEKIVINDFDVWSWFANKDGEVVFGIGSVPGKSNEELLSRIWVRKSSDDDWRVLRDVEFGREESFEPVGDITEDDKLLVISDYKVGRDSLYEYDVAKGEFGELVYSNEEYDLSGAIADVNGKIIGVEWIEDYRKQYFFDEEEAGLYKLIKKTFKGAEVWIQSMDESRKRLLVGAQRDNSPPKYFRLDIVSGKASFWLSAYPELEKIKMPEKRPFEYEARDGFLLNGYITLPLKYEGEKPPLIVMPHGGPQARDTRYFDWLSQFLANRGYAVLQPNFRGSTGFGTAYETAGYREWGKAMQADVGDAIAWVKEQGLADTGNMCLVGASYGGYVALTASVQAPEQFKCFVSIAGISDLEELVHSGAMVSGSREGYELLIGHPRKDEDVEDMRAHSAINFIDEIRRPILLIHGDEDTQVPYQQSEAFFEKATRAGKDVNFILQEDGTHYLDFGPHRIEALRATEEFLDKHL